MRLLILQGGHRDCSFVVALLTVAASVGEAAAEIRIQRIAMQSGPPVLLVKGEFALGDDPNVLSREVSATGAKIVTLESNGGNIAAAMAYGRMVRSLSLSTLNGFATPSSDWLW